MKITYIRKRFAPDSLALIELAESILREYARQGFTMTLRQLYYQFVARDLFPEDRRWTQMKDTKKWVRDPKGTKNALPNYKWLGDKINDGRLAGLIDWHFMADTTRTLRAYGFWESPGDIIEGIVDGYAIDKWADQRYRPECFSPDTPVLTRDGFVEIESIGIGDKVFTHNGRWRRVTKVIRTAYEGDMLEVNAAGILPFLVTPQHPMYTRPYDDSRPGYKGAERQFLPLQWRDSQQLKHHDRLLLPRIKRQYTKRIANTSLMLHGGPRSKSIELTIDHVALRVFGLYIAEGNIRSDKRTVQFTFGSHEEHHADLIKDWASNIGINTHTIFGPGTCVVYLFSKALADWLLDNFGSGAFQKHLPTWLMEAPFEMQTEVLEFYFRGDGNFWDISRGAIAATTRSRNLALQNQILFLWAGFAASLDVIMDAGAPRYRVSIGGADVVRLAKIWKIDIPEKGLGRSQRYNHIKSGEGDYAEFPVRLIRTIPYQGHVINLEVEEDSSYCIPVAAHNCWVEKDALLNVVSRACSPHEVPYFSCRGYTSQSAMWRASKRLQHNAHQGYIPYIIYLGDHDPSGMDMSRDIQNRLGMFKVPHQTEFTRLALNMDQVREHDPPPDFAKPTDSRSQSYVAEYGDDAWELDALEPSVIIKLIRGVIEDIVDGETWDTSVAKQEEERKQLRYVADNWDDIDKGD